MRLYGFPPTRALRVQWTLQELGLDFEYVTVDPRRSEQHAPEYLAINPTGKLPALVDGDLVLTESVAIVLYLAERYGGLLPADPAARAQVYRWLLFTATELEQALWRAARHTIHYPPERRIPAEIANARQDFLEMAAVMGRHLDGRAFLAGDTATVADIVAAYTLDMATVSPTPEGGAPLLADLPVLAAYLERMYARPQAPPRIREAFASL